MPRSNSGGSLVKCNAETEHRLFVKLRGVLAERNTFRNLRQTNSHSLRVGMNQGPRSRGNSSSFGPPGPRAHRSCPAGRPSVVSGAGCGVGFRIRLGATHARRPSIAGHQYGRKLLSVVWCVSLQYKRILSFRGSISKLGMFCKSLN